MVTHISPFSIEAVLGVCNYVFDNSNQHHVVKKTTYYPITPFLFQRYVPNDHLFISKIYLMTLFLVLIQQFLSKMDPDWIDSG